MVYWKKGFLPATMNISIARPIIRQLSARAKIIRKGKLCGFNLNKLIKKGDLKMFF